MNELSSPEFNDPPAAGKQQQGSATSGLSVSQAQAQVDQWIQQIGVRYFDPMTNLAQLAEEVGEVARVMSRTYGEQSWKSGQKQGCLADELADVLFVILCLANQTGIDLETALQANLAKKTQRDQRRHHENPKLQAPTSQ